MTHEALYFWSGVLIAAVPVIVFASLAGVLVYLYVRSQKQRDEPTAGDGPAAR